MAQRGKDRQSQSCVRHLRMVLTGASALVALMPSVESRNLRAIPAPLAGFTQYALATD